ncbi:hypothetical protein [Bosea sp. TAF32]|uniref:hypothetical protein n=1 Tax=Bosea sp. TAF32 TaxID=3237482 RepID=UPI003F90ED67
MKTDEAGSARQKYTFKRQIGFHAIIFVRAALACYSRCASTSQALRDDFDVQTGAMLVRGRLRRRRGTPIAESTAERRSSWFATGTSAGMRPDRLHLG